MNLIHINIQFITMDICSSTYIKFRYESNLADENHEDENGVCDVNDTSCPTIQI